MKKEPVTTYPLADVDRARRIARALNSQTKRGVIALGSTPMRYSARKWRNRGVWYIALFAVPLEPS